MLLKSIIQLSTATDFSIFDNVLHNVDQNTVFGMKTIVLAVIF